MIIEHDLYPPHLGKEFLETYSNIRTRRLIAKKNKIKVIDKTLKLSLNGLSGNLQNEHSWCYSPFTVMQIRINGQLLLLMLSERLLSLGCKLHQINTDGILYTCKKDKYEELQTVLSEWEKLTKLTLETEKFTSFYQLAINDYFGVDINNDIKKKGFLEKAAFLSTNFGALDNHFYIDGELQSYPAGIAHFLEHKLFEGGQGRDVALDFVKL